MAEHKYGTPDQETEEAVAKLPLPVRISYEFGSWCTATRLGHWLSMGLTATMLVHGIWLASAGIAFGWFAIGGALILGTALTAGTITDAIRRR
ncbi:hypothetical protein FHW79_005365 [Azospirillum sp. OGB3]|uniref:hypothetical protein n=1 Tax=Azospirillum sp. OGB3 TaxID=2587012 RepID=UPI0016062A6D|nr:hypothetical protein [Azospirillum sp. OGB3]MBB3267700.1 hypothetical protein [Azospirillum sp. OGB3]